jgi:hypothetical protein
MASAPCLQHARQRQLRYVSAWTLATADHNTFMEKIFKVKVNIGQHWSNMVINGDRSSSKETEADV